MLWNAYLIALKIRSQESCEQKEYLNLGLCRLAYRYACHKSRHRSYACPPPTMVAATDAPQQQSSERGRQGLNHTRARKNESRKKPAPAKQSGRRGVDVDTPNNTHTSYVPCENLFELGLSWFALLSIRRTHEMLELELLGRRRPFRAQCGPGRGPALHTPPPAGTE